MNSIVQLYAIPILGALLIIGLAIFFRRKKGNIPQVSPNKKKKAPEENQESIAARIYDNIKRRVYLDNITGDDIDEIKNKCSSLGRLYNYRGKSVYAFVKTIEEKFVPLAFYMSRSMENPPARLWDALQQQEVHIIFNVQPPKSFMQKYGAILLFVFGICFLGFMMVMNKRG